MKKTLLSICIATYNRADFIGETLESIIPQITNEVEIVVVDGASTDDTRNVVKRYVEVCKQINYVQLPLKGGIDQDFCKAVELAKGEYCWLFADDDLLKSDAISTVLSEILKGYSLIIVNALVMNNDCSRVIENKRLQIDTDEIYDESQMDQFFHRILPYITFIGCVVINRDVWMQREKKRYFGTEFIHAGVIFQAPLPAPALVLAQPYIIIRFGNAQWTQRMFEIWMYKWPNLLSSFTHISDQVKEGYQKTTQSWRRLKHIITFRAMGTYSLKEYNKWFASEDSSFWWKFTIWFIAVMPAWFVRLILLFYYKMIKKDALVIDSLTNNKNNIITIVRNKDC